MGDEIAKRMHWLMGQVICGKHPITEAEILKFGTNPQVIIPENAVELIKVADQLPQLKPRWHDNVPGGLLLDEDGPISLVYDMDKKEVNLYRRKQAIECLGVFEEYSSLAYEAEIKLLAMIDGQPLWTTSSRYLYGQNKEITWRLYLGKDEVAALTDISHFCILTYRHMLAYSAKRKDYYDIELSSVGRKPVVMPHDLLTKDGKEVIFIKKVGSKIWLGTEERIIVEEGAWLQGHGMPIAVYDGHGYQAVVCVEKGKSCVFVGDVKWNDNQFSGYFSPQCDARQNPISIGDLPYSHGISKLPNDSWAYVGITRHQQRCWVIDGKPKEAWNWVSDLFQHSVYGPCYWGMTPTHLVLMKL